MPSSRAPATLARRSSLRPCAVLQSQAPSPQCLVAKLSLRQGGYQSLLQELLKNYRKKPFSCTSTTITCQPRAISPSWSHDSQPLSRQEKREGHTKQAPRQHEHLPRLTPSWKRPPMNLLAVAQMRAVAQNPSTPTHGMPTAAKKSLSAQISLLKRRGLHPAKRKLHVAADLSTITPTNVKDETPPLTTIATGGSTAAGPPPHYPAMTPQPLPSTITATSTEDEPPLTLTIAVGGGTAARPLPHHPAMTLQPRLPPHPPAPPTAAGGAAALLADDTHAGDTTTGGVTGTGMTSGIIPHSSRRWRVLHHSQDTYRTASTEVSMCLLTNCCYLRAQYQYPTLHGKPARVNTSTTVK